MIYIRVCCGKGSGNDDIMLVGVVGSEKKIGGDDKVVVTAVVVACSND